MRIEWTCSDELIPAPSPVMEHSVFVPVERARPITPEPAVVPLEDARGAPPLSLVGEWRRKAAEPDAHLASPEIDDSLWPRTPVPDSYGSDPCMTFCFGPVWYRRRVAPPHPLPDGGSETPSWVDLVFESADYFAEVFLDGHDLGRHEGYFAPFSYDVTDLIERGSLLAVKVSSPLEELDPERWFVFHRKRHIKGAFAHHESRPGGLPGKASPGWSGILGQSEPSAGLTGDVFLRRTGPIRIDAVFSTPRDAVGGVHLALVFTNRSVSPVETEILVEIRPDARAHGAPMGMRAELPVGHSRIDVDLSIDPAAVWRPVGWDGAGNMYTLVVSARAQGVLSDVRTERTGLRTAGEKWGDDPQHPAYEFRLNGRKMFLVGANYLPAQHLADLDKEFYRRDFELARSAGVNFLSLQAHQQRKACYDVADEMGLLLSQDFSLQWNYASGDSDEGNLRERACRMAAEMAYLLWNHPSVVRWCCHNEPSYIWATDAQPNSATDFDNRVLDEEIRGVLTAIDKSRPVHLASGIGDEHRYEGSISGGEMTDFGREAVAYLGEFGFPAPSFAGALAGDVGWPPNERELVEWAGRMGFMGTAAGYVGAPARYSSFQTWCYALQRYQAALVKRHTEIARTLRASGLGAYRVQTLVDWRGWWGMGLLDSTRRPKLAFDWFRRAASPVSAIALPASSRVLPGSVVEVPVWVLSDLPEDVHALVVEWRAFLAEEFEVITTDPAASQLGAPGVAPPPGYSLALPLNIRAGRNLAEGSYYQPARAGSSTVAGIAQVALPAEMAVPACLVIETRWSSPSGVSGENWESVLVADEIWVGEPGIRPEPRFDLAIAVDGVGEGMVVKVFREYRPGDGGIEMETDWRGRVVARSLPPDVYRVEVPAVRSSREVLLLETREIVF